MDDSSRPAPAKRRAIFFDDGKGLLSPLTDLRPAYAVRTGPLTIAERLTLAYRLEVVGAIVPPALAELAREQTSVPVNEQPAGEDPITLINARLALPIPEIAQLEPGQVLADRDTQDMVAACLRTDDALALLTGGNPPLTHTMLDAPPLLRRPWDVRTYLERTFAVDMELLARLGPEPITTPPAGVTLLGEHPVRIHPSATVHPTVVLDASKGEISIDENAEVRPQSILCGPVYVGPGTIVQNQSQLKALTAIGPVCRVAGEVGGSVFQGYANKSHDGHLGDAWLGEWVNLGAGTVNSNLLNTYSEIPAVAPGGSRERTGLTFFGCVLGDHVKTAIGTRIMTGSIVGTGAMHAASTPISGTVDRFGWTTDAGVRTYRLGKFVEVAMAAMGRRGIEPSQAYSRRLTILHEATTGEHAAVNWPGKLPAEPRSGGPTPPPTS